MRYRTVHGRRRDPLVNHVLRAGALGRASVLALCASIHAYNARAETIAGGLYLRPSLDTGPNRPNTSGARQFLLELWVNGQSRRAVVRVTERDGRLFLSRKDAADAGIKAGIKNSGAPVDALHPDDVDLSRLPGVSAKIEDVDQQLLLEVASERLNPNVFDLKSSAAPDVQESGTGAIVSYDAAVTAADLTKSNTAAFNGDLAATLFTPLGTLTGDGVAATQAGGGQAHAVRLDTAAEIDDPGTLQRWVAGDAVTGGLSWSRPIRVGGVQWSSDFTLRPDFILFPLPQFYGQTAVPSSVDVLVNSARVFESDVAPGPFELRNIPVLTGDGNVQVVTKDALGRETTQTIALYTSQQMLREGLWSYALDAGATRQAYGVKSFSYGDPAGTATARYGYTPWLTLESHAEFAKDLQLAGGGADVTLGSLGVAGVDAAFSHSAPAGSGLAGVTGKSAAGKSTMGALYSVSLQSNPKPFGFYAQASLAADGFRDLAALSGAAPQTLRLQVGGNVTLGKGNAVSLAWVDLKTPGEAETQLATASYTLSFDGWMFSTTGFYDRMRSAWSGEALVTIPIGGNSFGSVSANRGPGFANEQAAFVKAADPDGGLGYRLSRTQGTDESTQGEVTWFGSHGGLDAAIDSSRGVTAGQFTASGGVVAIGDSVFATARPSGSVALVRAGAENVHIERENREVAVTDSDGEALVTNLIPNGYNRVAVDSRDYPLGTVIDTTEKTVVPPRQSGIIVDLAPPVRHPLLATVLLPGGEAPPVGARVVVQGAGDLVMGHNGQIFVPDLPEPAQGAIMLPKGACRFALAMPGAAAQGKTATNAIPRQGPLNCRMESGWVEARRG